MEEWFKESREKTKERKNRALEQQRLRAKKQKRNDIIAFIMFVIAMIILIVLSMKLGQKSISDCINAGHSVEYCERGL